MREFNAHAAKGWTGRRVIEAFGRWSTAIEALNGFSRQNAEQRAYRQQIAGPEYASRPPLQSVRAWLATDPRLLDRHAYDRWARAENTTDDSCDGWHLGSTTIMQRLSLAWSQVVKVAKGEIRPEDAPRRSGREKPTWSNGPHTFLGRREVAARLDLDYQQLRRHEGQRGFPAPVLVLGTTPAWLDTQIDAYVAKQPLPPFDRDALRPAYLTAAELAPRLRVTAAALRQPGAHAPKPTAAICGKHIWHRPDVERWEAETPPSPYSGRARKAPAAE